MAKRKPPEDDDAEPLPVADSRWKTRDEYWWKAPVGQPVHEKVVKLGQWLRSLYISFHHRLRMYEWLYEGSELRRSPQALAILAERGMSSARLNVSESIIDTVVARLSKRRPMPSFVVDDASWTLKRKAKQYRKFILGEMLATEFDEKSRDCLLDGAVVGMGFTRIDDTGDGDSVFAERVLWDEVFFDPRESKYGTPPNAFRVYRVARDRLIEMYPEFASQIIAAAPSAARPNDDTDDGVTKTLDLEDYTDVYEAWHLPRCEDDDADDGRHVLCIENATLCSECWYEPRFPIAIYRYKKCRRGIWSKGVMFKLKDIQHRINSIARDIQMNVQATGRGYFLQQEGTALPVEMLSGWQPFHIKYKGSVPPTWQAPQPFNQAQLEALEKFIQYAHDLIGISQMATTSRSSLGPGASGIALDTQYDIESERFAMQEAAYADYRIHAAQLYIDASKRVARKRMERKGTKRSSVYVSRFVRRDAIEQLEYDKVSLKTDEYKLQLEPVNFLPDTRAGKLSAVGQLAQAGIIPQWLAAALFDEPDLERANRITLSAFWNAERKMEDLADETKEMPVPSPAYNDIDLEITMCKAYTNHAEAEHAPDEIQDRYRQYLSLLGDAKQQQQAALAPPMPPGQMNGPAALPGAQPMLPQGAPMPGSGEPPPPMPQKPPIAA
jgi:hypothetical protein